MRKDIMKEKVIDKVKKHQILFLTLLAGFLGFIVFIFIYGVEVLDVTKDVWLNEPGELSQHYFGWAFYRNADWNLKIGEFNTLSYPNNASIIFTDSIPLFAVIFKAISFMLPETFQYLGIFELICYILQGIFAFTLLRRFIKNKYYAIMGTVFFILSPYLLQRALGHTALSANFLILAALCLWAYREKYKNNQKKKILFWTILLIVGTTIHLYYIPMIVVIMFGTFISEFIEDKKTWKVSIITFITSCISSILVIYILGGMSASSYGIGGLGYFNSNLDTFINPQNYSYFLKNRQGISDGEFEGFGYLGLGIILMCFLMVIIIFKEYDKKKLIEQLKKPNTIFAIFCIVRKHNFIIRNYCKIRKTFLI